MKYLVLVLLVFMCLSSFAQEPVYTPMRGNYKFKGIKVDTLLLIPSFSDTSAANSTYLDQVAGAMIRTGNDFWMRNANATSWLQNVNVGNGASPVMDFVNQVFKKNAKDSVFYIVAPHDTFFAFKDKGIDSLKRRKDSVFTIKYGVEYFQYKDSTGGGGTDSPDRIDGSAIQNVKADMNDFNLIFDAVDTFEINNSNKIFIKTDNRISVQNYSSSSSKTSGEVQFGLGRSNVDLGSQDDTLYIPGTYIVTTNGYNLYFPKVDEFAGQTFYIINRSGAAININSISGTIFDQSLTTTSDIQTNKFAIVTSDGHDWWIFNAN
jgi:hypothetical protein